MTALHTSGPSAAVLKHSALPSFSGRRSKEETDAPEAGSFKRQSSKSFVAAAALYSIEEIMAGTEKRLASRMSTLEASVERRQAEVAVILGTLVQQQQQQMAAMQQWQQQPQQQQMPPLGARGDESSLSKKRVSFEQENVSGAYSGGLAGLSATGIFAATGNAAAADNSVEEMWSLVESDAGIRSMLKDIRDKVERRAFPDSASHRVDASHRSAPKRGFYSKARRRASLSRALTRGGSSGAFVDSSADPDGSRSPGGSFRGAGSFRSDRGSDLSLSERCACVRACVWLSTQHLRLHDSAGVCAGRCCPGASLALAT